MNIPLIIQLSNELRARRMSEPNVLLHGFGGMLLTAAGYGVYRAAQYYISFNLPVNLLVLGVVGIWILAGIRSQMHLIRDRELLRFISIMPVKPKHLLALHVYVSLLPTIVACVCLLCLIAGSGFKLWTLSATPRWLVVAIGLVWVLFFETAIALTISRFVKGQVAFWGLTLFWMLVLLLRLGWSLRFGQSPDYIHSVSNILATDVVLAVSGIGGFVHTLTASNEILVRSSITTSIHMVCVVLVFAYYCWRLIKRLPVNYTGNTLPVALSNPTKHIIRRAIPGPLGGQMCIEWLRILRSTNPMVVLYVLIILAIVIVDRLRVNGGNVSLSVVVFGAMAMAVDTGVYILDNQRGKLLYDLYGVDAGDYLLSFVTSLGIVIAMLCVVQIPIIGSFDCVFVATIFSACTATSIALIDVGIVIERRSQKIGIFSKLIVVIVCFFITQIMLAISLYNFFIPLLIVGALLILSTRRANRDIVKNLYWGL